MQLVPERPNVELRSDPERGRIVVLAFPYDRHLVEAVRAIPHRRFDWDTYEWWAPLDDWVALHVGDVLRRFPELEPSEQVAEWLEGIEKRWLGHVRTTRHDARGWWVLETLAGEVPAALLEGSVTREEDGALLVPLTEANAHLLREQESAKLDAAADRTVATLELGDVPPPARLVGTHGVEGARLRLEVLWDPTAGHAFDALPGNEGERTIPVDPWLLEPLDAFIALHDVEVSFSASATLRKLREEAALAAAAIRASRATEGEPLPEIAARLGGELEPFQWAGVRYVLDARRTFLADEQGLGKTVEALAAIEADDAYPAIVVCPASLKLNWEREARRWLPHRRVVVVEGRQAVPRTDEITILNYEVVDHHRETLARMRPGALVLDEAHYCKNPSAKRTRAVRRLAESMGPDRLRLALTGTPVLNHPDELIAQLRVLGRLEDFGSGARFKQQFRGPLTEERLHWHLRRRCFVRRLKSEVLPQLPAKRQTVVPVALDNMKEYRLAEDDVIKWLREQPLDLSELNAKIAATLRAKRLAQLGALQRIAARGKLGAALAWIDDFLASGEPLVVFARHVEVQEAVLARFPDAAHLLGRDTVQAREAAVRAFQEPDGPQLVVAATRVAGQGITLTRASNVAFLELEWTPAMHDQAEDRCHRIGQRDAVTAWYLLAARTIDETMARLIQRKRGIVAAVTDGRRLDGDSLVEEVVRELRDGRPFRHLKAVTEPAAAT
ncbi:DEAD/DEAH box helicase [Conexibacter stalactiti]|uniref:DEAD/DEAH box helicase n=1 Tax=Conexibacter stalactiti TaxID=1940611 RepID=A0ABU4HNU5_9ACTN|nr:DEAD/DEAH box helicase [Conexibacter stalactiti]MDW5594939.1 DEAD/DEAH box helicase [Conexibacter stalactiti]MEC5035581.1 DEAD/DEAH box helicase [Conexibacter stalactiti]